MLPVKRSSTAVETGQLEHDRVTNCFVSCASAETKQKKLVDERLKTECTTRILSTLGGMWKKAERRLKTIDYEGDEPKDALPAFFV